MSFEDYEYEDGHSLVLNRAGDGVTEPRELWISCSCGELLWTWQQFYHESDALTEDEYLAHVTEVRLLNKAEQGE